MPISSNAPQLDQLPQLIQSLDSPDEQTQQNAKEAIFKLSYAGAVNDMGAVSISDESLNKNRKAIQKAGGIALLIPLLSSPNELTKQYALEVLNHLSNYSSNATRGIILEADVITLLVQLSKFSNVLVTRHAMRILSSWSSIDGTRDAIRNAGGIESFVLLLGFSDEKTQIDALGALNEMIHQPDYQNAIQEAIQDNYSIAQLIQLSSSSNRSIQYYAQKLLNGLSFYDLTSIQDANDPLLNQLMNSSDPFTRYYTAMLLFRLPDDAKNQNAIMLGTETLIQLMMNPVALARGDTEERLPHNIASVLAAHSNFQALRDGNGMTTLVHLLHSPDNRMKVFSMQILLDLIDRHEDDGDDIKNAIRNAGAFTALIHLSNSSNQTIARRVNTSGIVPATYGPDSSNQNVAILAQDLLGVLNPDLTTIVAPHAVAPHAAMFRPSTSDDSRDRNVARNNFHFG